MNESIYQWIKAGLIGPEHQASALAVAGERPSRAGWLLFVRRLLVLLGLLSMAFGVVFFFAYNWNDLGRQFKFIALQGLMVGSFLLYLFKAKSPWTAQALLLSAVLVLGALLALFGQTYQTGADPWQLFATWAMLITPLVLFSRAEVLWLVLVLLLNTALSLYLQVNRSLLGWALWGHHMTWVLFLLNGAFLLLTEWLASGRAQRWVHVALSHRWAAQVLGVVVIYLLGIMGLEAIWGRVDYRAINALLFLGFMGLLCYVYRYRCRDLLLLTAWMLAVIVFIMSLLANAVLDQFDAGGLLLMAVALITLSTLAVRWLKKTHLSFKQEVNA
ncbi:DUF2157 domain-containing protein [Marinicella meishanensis]|uniref:DUF2157 domain-containing protein n=1 Tax=Marinicella meishanensis TaxID=2873263 RepID=UPI001CBC48B4|nr:DUF2157 domain-containing protein [Marinicella sp. NBU2979]